MLLRFPLDIIELIVIRTESYFCYTLLCDVFEGLKNEQRRLRIINALTKKAEYHQGDPPYNVMCTRYSLDGYLHRENDLPAIEYDNGHKEWIRHGLLHRDDDKPAVIQSCGTNAWYQNGKLHREDDKPAIEFISGSKHYYRNGFRHRVAGKPAIVAHDGTKKWYFNGVLHRDNGLPAVEWANGEKEWWYKGERYIFREHLSSSRDSLECVLIK